MAATSTDSTASNGVGHSADRSPPTRRSSSARSRGSRATSPGRISGGRSETRRVRSRRRPSPSMKRSSTATATASASRSWRSSTSGSEWTRAVEIEHPITTVAALGKLDASPTAATGLPRRGTSITRRRRTRPSTSPPTGRLPTASKATPRASTWATSTGSPRCPIGY